MEAFIILTLLEPSEGKTPMPSVEAADDNPDGNSTNEYEVCDQIWVEIEVKVRADETERKERIVAEDQSKGIVSPIRSLAYDSPDGSLHPSDDWLRPFSIR